MKFEPTKKQASFKKIAIFGGPGCGKTIVSLSSPGNKIALDTEGGCLPFAELTDVHIIYTQSFGEIKSIIDDLERNPPKEETSLIIDSASIIWSGLQQAMLEKKMSEKGITVMEGTEKVVFNQADWGVLKRWNKDIMNTLMALKCHVICTFRESEEVDQNDSFKRTGTFLPQWEKNTAYTFDFVGRIHDRKLTFTKARLAKNGKLVDLMGKTVVIPTVVDGSDLPKIWESIFGVSKEIPVSAHPLSKESSKDVLVVQKDPESIKLAHEIRSRLLPKRSITNESAEAYLLSKVTSKGRKLLEMDEKGEVHMSSMLPEDLRWFKDILEDDQKSMQLAGKLLELKGVKNA